jgi:hypothetical protein
MEIFESFHEEEIRELIKLNKTYVVKKFKDIVSDTTEYSEVILKIKNYDVHKFKYVDSYCILIYPDENFIELLKIYNENIEDEIDLNLNFEISINKNKLNLIDFQEGIPKQLRNFGLGYKLYKLVIEKNEFITSNRYCFIEAKNIWYNLMKDVDLYCFTSNFISGVIYKKLNNTKIKIILDNIKIQYKDDLIFDNELEQKITEIYGSVDIYKQEN